MNKHRRDSRRILINAQRAGDTSFRAIISSGLSYVSAPFLEMNAKRAISSLLCVTVAAAFLAMAFGFPQGSTQVHTRFVCAHVCDDGCYVMPNEHVGSTDAGVTPLYLAATSIKLPSYLHVMEEAIISNDVASVDLSCDCDGLDAYVHVPSTLDEPGLLSDSRDRNDVRAGGGHEENDADHVMSLNPDTVGNDETAYGDGFGPTDGIDLTDTFQQGVSLFAEPDISLTERFPGMSDTEGYTLTIVVIGEDGMALGSQSGHMLLADPMKPPRSFVIDGVLDGEMIIIVASPDDEDHFVHWFAFLTDDSTQRIPLSSHTHEPPVSVRTLIMPEGDATIVIEFSADELDSLDLLIYTLSKEDLPR